MNAKPILEPSFWTVPMLAHAWSEPEDKILVCIHDGTITAETRDVDGIPRAGITPDEKRRIEGGERPLGKRKEDSYRAIIAALAVQFVGSAEDPMLDKPYELLGLLEQSAAACGAAMLRGDDTNAAILGDAIQFARSAGLIKRKANPAAAREAPKTATDAASELGGH